LLILLAAMAFVPALGCSSSETVGGTTQKLEARCTDVGVEDEDWLCPRPWTAECENGSADPAVIYFQPSDRSSEGCEQIDELGLSHRGPFVGLGPHQVVITPLDANEELVEETCESTLTVVDTLDPEANTEPIELWPPNHKFHTIYGEDCVRDACDQNVTVTFDSASSDERANDNGDGNTEPDIILECDRVDRVQLRAERQGGGNGRTYRLGWTAVDASGHPAKGECVVRVPHDQSGEDVDDEDPPIEEEAVTLDCGGDEGSDGEVP
jgi:hypothetical protein